jgi:outer membrane protein assembly complex protein YaeT
VSSTDAAQFSGRPVASVRFEGASSQWRSRLRSVIATRPNPWWKALLFWRKPPTFDATAAETDRERIAVFYRDRGYYAVVVEPLQVRPRDGRVDVTFSLTEGPRTRVDAIALTVEGEQPPQGEDFRPVLPLQVGDYLDAEPYQASKQYIARWYAARGYAHAKVLATARLDAQAASATVELNVRTGASYRHGPTDIKVGGRDAVDPKIIRRYLGWEEGDVYDLRKLERTQQDLYGIGLFRSVEVYPEFETWTERDEASRYRVGDRNFVPMATYIKTLSAPPRRVSLGIGWGSEEYLRGTVEWAHRNLFGDGENLSLRIRGSRLGYEGSGTFVDPALFGTRAGGSSNVSLSRRIEPPYDVKVLHVDLLVERRRGAVRGNLGPVVESARLSGVVEPVRAAYVPDPKLTTVGLQANAIYDTTDNPLDARKGVRSSATIERGFNALGGELPYWQGGLDGRVYLPFGRRWTIAARGELRGIRALGNAVVPLYRRFLTGGSASVRGYPRHVIGFRDPAGNLVGGTDLLLMSMELHYRLNERVAFVGFGDAGSAPVGDLRRADLVYGAGVGIRYHTIVGPLRVDVAYPLTEFPPHTNWRIHASIGQAF